VPTSLSVTCLVCATRSAPRLATEVIFDILYPHVSPSLLPHITPPLPLLPAPTSGFVGIPETLVICHTGRFGALSRLKDRTNGHVPVG
jgi:hypothetical protein